MNGARPPTRVLFPSMRVRKSSGSSPSPRKGRDGVVSFTLNDHAKPMQGRALLDVSPEDIIKSILERREKTARKLPSLIDERTSENNRAYRLAKESHDALKLLLEGTETNQSENDAIKKAQNIYEENEAFRRRTVSRLQTAKNQLQDHEDAVLFWSELIDKGWGHLLEDSARIESGGVSSYALTKNNKNNGEL